MAPRRLRVALPCPGLGRTRRGYERFTEELARALAPHADVAVFAGRMPPSLREPLPSGAMVRGGALPCAPRAWLERAGFNPHRAYYWEQVTFGAALGPALLAFRPDVVHFSDPALTNVYLRWRRVLPGHPPFVFCNGGNLSPEHWRRYHHTQLVAPWQAEGAAALGVEPASYSVVPLGTDVARCRAGLTAALARARLDLPPGLLAISVASLDRSIKRLDFLINELAQPAAEGWTLLCLGQETSETAELRALADRVAPGRVLFRTAAPQDVPRYLAAADLFLLASASEGFGLALLEAMAAGLPALVRDLPSLRYVVDDPSQFLAMDTPGQLAPSLALARDQAWRSERGARNAARAAARFDWQSLVPAYLALYERALLGSRP